jgi:hypothetical protein
MGWSRKSYDAVHDWGDVRKRERIEAIMLADGLTAEVERLRSAKTMGEWHAITMEAVAAVGPQVVKASAGAAERSLAQHASKGNAVYLSADLVAQVGIEVARLKADGKRASIKGYIEEAVKEKLGTPHRPQGPAVPDPDHHHRPRTG